MNLENYFDIKDLLTKFATEEGRLSASISAEMIEDQVFAEVALTYAEGSRQARGHHLTSLGFTEHESLSAFLAEVAHGLYCQGNVGFRIDSSDREAPRFTLVAPDFAGIADTPNVRLVRATTGSLLADGFGRSYLHDAIPAYVDMGRAYRSVVMEQNEHMKRQFMRQTLTLRAQVVAAAGLEYRREGPHPLSRPLSQRLFDETVRVFQDHVAAAMGLSVEVSGRPVELA